MKIEAMPVKRVEVSKDNSRNESKSDEFSKVLSKEFSKEDKVNLSKERKSLESEDDNKPKTDILESLIGMLNVPLGEGLESEDISLELDSGLVGENSLTIEGISMNLVDFKSITIGDITLNPEEALYFDVDMSSEEATPIINGTNNIAEELVQVVSKDEKFDGLISDSVVLDDSFKIEDSSNKDSTNMEFANIRNLNEAIPTENKSEMTFEENPEKELETSIKVEPEKEPDLVENKGINYSENSTIKEFNKVNVEVKPEAQRQVLSNDNLQRVNDAIIQQIETTTKDGSSVMKVKLYPENLGTVDVTVSMEEGKLVAKIIVDNEHAKGLFAGKLSELSESLVKQNIQVEKINIDLNLNSNSNPENKQGFDLNQQGNFNNNRGSKYRNQVKMYNSKVENLATDSSNIGSNGAISILA